LVVVLPVPSKGWGVEQLHGHPTVGQRLIALTRSQLHAEEAQM